MFLKHFDVLRICRKVYQYFIFVINYITNKLIAFSYRLAQSAADAAKLNRKESYKAQRKNYRREKKRVASELMNSLQDPAVIVLADWLKVRCDS